jgi:uroporphyrin-III C-methyltransferase/precorrin-2 dehydrogenase/sirohydrochlorin ferrochelatase
MRHFPLFLDLQGRDVAVVGGGEVALRKVQALLSAGAVVTVVAPELHPALAAQLVQRTQQPVAIDGLALSSGAMGILHHVRDVLPADPAVILAADWFMQAWLVVAATDNEAVNAAVAAAGAQARKFVNVVDDSAKCSAIVPAVIDRSPLLVAVSTSGTAPMLARRVRRDIELLLDGGLGRLAQFFARWRERVTSAVPTPARRRELYDRWMDGEVARLVQAGREDAAGEALLASLDSAASIAADPAVQGHVTLVGAGPGDAGLLTLAGLQALQRADVILVDRLVSAEVRALARRDALQVEVGKEGGGHSVTQDEIHRLLLHYAREGLNVVRLKGGDPFVFGRGGEELLCLRAAGIPYAVVPGVTAALACAAQAGLPLTHRDVARSVRFATAHCRGSSDETDWAGLAAEEGTLVLYMGLSQSPRVQRELLARGRTPHLPAAIIENGGRREQRVVLTTLGHLAAAVRDLQVGSPALLVLGPAVELTKQLHWQGAAPVLYPAPAESTELDGAAA